MPSFRIDVKDDDAVKGEIEVDFECYCGNCGAPMCFNVENRRGGRRNNVFDITPCEKCCGDDE